MAQSRLMSAAEAGAHTVTGLILGVSINWLILPLMGYPITIGQSSMLVVIFTVVSFVRSYVFRRLFTWIETRRLTW